MRTTLRRLVLVLVFLGVVGAIALALRPRPVPIDVATVRAGPMRVIIDEEGKTRIRERYVVSSPLRGRLRRITLDPGDAVIAEQTTLALVEPTDPDLLDPRAQAESEARVRAAEATVSRANADLERTRAEHDFAANERGRVRQARERNATTEHELDQAEATYRSAAQSLRAAEFAEDIAKYELEVARSALLYARGQTPTVDQGQMVLSAPIDGVVLRVFQESVAVVSPGTPLLEIGDPRDLEVVVDVLSTDAVRIRPGQSVIIDHWGGATQLQGAVRLVEPSAFTKVSALGVEEQRVNVIVDFMTPRDDRRTLGDGFRVDAGIVEWESDEVLQVPTSACFRQDDGWAVFTASQGRAQVRLITPGRRSGSATQVLSGLDVGDVVIRHPGDQVRNGIRVRERRHD